MQKVKVFSLCLFSLHVLAIERHVITRIISTRVRLLDGHTSARESECQSARILIIFYVLLVFGDIPSGPSGRAVYFPGILFEGRLNSKVDGAEILTVVFHPYSVGPVAIGAGEIGRRAKFDGSLTLLITGALRTITICLRRVRSCERAAGKFAIEDQKQNQSGYRKKQHRKKPH